MVRIVPRMTVLRFGALPFALNVITHDVETAHDAAAERTTEDAHVRAVVPDQPQQTAFSIVQLIDHMEMNLENQALPTLIINTQY